MDFVSFGMFVLNTDSGQDTVNVRNTSAGVSIQIHGGNQDTVNIGDNGSVQGILAPVTVDNPPSWNTINIDDSADAAARTVGLSTSPDGNVLWGTVSGLAPANIDYICSDTSSVHVATGSGGNTVDVFQTGVPTFVSSYGPDKVNVGFVGSVQGILGDLTINNPPSHDTININDSQDHTPRTVTLGTFTTSGWPWGSVTGLAPAPIYYKYLDTSSVHLTTSTAGNTINVRETGVPTYLTTLYSALPQGFNTVNVGDAGRV
jgi:hypothetical protein